MDLHILKIASDTSNMKKLSYFTHSAKTRNPMCGDNITFKINLNITIQFQNEVYWVQDLNFSMNSVRVSWRDNDTKMLNNCHGIASG